MTALNTLLTSICNMLNAHGTMLFISDRQQCTLLSAANAGAPVPRRCVIEPGKGIVGWILRNQEPFMTNSFDANSGSLGYYEPAAERAITAFLGVPLPDGGALCVDAVDARRVFSVQDRTILCHCAASVAAVYSLTLDSSHQNEIQQHLETSAALLDLPRTVTGWRRYAQAFLDRVLAGLQMDYAALVMAPEHAEGYTVEAETSPLMIGGGTRASLAKGTGLVGFCLMEGTSVFAEGLDGTETTPPFGRAKGMPVFQAAICVPVLHFHAVCGALLIAAGSGRPFGPSTRTFATMAATILGDHLDALSLQHSAQGRETKQDR